MKKIFFIPFAAALLMACAGGNKSGETAEGVDSTAIRDSIARVDSLQRADSIQKADSIQRADSIQKAESAKMAEEVAAKNYLTRLYNVVLNNGGNQREVTSHFSPSVKRRLIAANDYDDGGMALWELRTMAQDGPSSVSKVKSITRQGDWYVVSYSDMGNPGATKLKLVVKDGNVTVTDYRRVR